MTEEPAVDVLFVDLDGTLVATDVLWEALLLAVKRDPRVLLQLPRWAARGRAVAKRTLAQQVTPDPRLLPYHEEVLAFLQAEKGHGRPLVLATANDRLWAQAVSHHVNLFDDVLASDGERNLKGSAKLRAIRTYCQARGYDTFAYIGDATADLPIWEQAAHVYVVAPSKRLRTALTDLRQPVRIVAGQRSHFAPAIHALWSQRWVKNMLLFVPLISAPELASSHKMLLALLAFVALSLCDSAAYMLNDMLHVEADRRHPKKRYRPFAAGMLPLAYGMPLSGGLLACGLGLALLTLPWSCVGALLVYMLLTALDTFRLKPQVILNMPILAGLYVLRVLIGGMATDIQLSQWLFPVVSFFRD